MLYLFVIYKLFLNHIFIVQIISNINYLIKEPWSEDLTGCWWMELWLSAVSISSVFLSLSNILPNTANVEDGMKAKHQRRDKI